MLEIVNGKLQKYLLEETNLYEKENIIDMSLLLNIGNIKNLEETEIRYECNKKIITKEKIDNLKQKLKEENTIRIWYSSIDAEDYCFFLYVVYLTKKYDIKIKIIDVGIYNKWTLTNYEKEEIKDLVKIEKQLTEEEINDIRNRWIELEKENADLRIIDNKKMKSVNYEYLDNKILDKLKKHDEILETKFLVNIRNNINVGINEFIIYDYRIEELIKQNKIKIVRKQKIKNILGKLEEKIVLKINEN